MAEEESGDGRKTERTKMKRIYLHDVAEEWEDQKIRFLGPDQYRRSDQDFARHLLQVHNQMCSDPKCRSASAQLQTQEPCPRLFDPDPPPLQPLSGSASGPRHPLHLHHEHVLRPMPRLTPIKVAW